MLRCPAQTATRELVITPFLRPKYVFSKLISRGKQWILHRNDQGGMWPTLQCHNGVAQLKEPWPFEIALASIRKCTHTRRPLGTREFAHDLEKSMLRLQSTGRD
jgi:hypothetical protein